MRLTLPDASEFYAYPLFNARKALFVGAHTDDEMICAGTLHRLVREGCEVHVSAMSTAATKDDTSGMLPSWRVLEPEFKASMELIGVRHAYYHGFYPSKNLADLGQGIADDIYHLCVKLEPDLVISLSPDDENPAHSVIGVQVRRVVRGRVPTLIECQFPWNHSLGRPNLFVMLSEKDIEVKMNVIDCYKSQHFRYMYGKMLISYAIADGLSVKVPAAEKFEIIRSVV